MIIIPLF